MLSFLKSRYLTGSSRHLPLFPICMQSEVSGLGTFLQVKPASVWQVLEQPSPDTVLPSSHCSPASTFPFPQTVEQAWVVPAVPAVHEAVAARQIGSFVHVFEQPVPSPLKRPLMPVQPLGIIVGSLPQSQDSPVSLMPLPQMAVVHFPAAGAPDAVVGQVEAGSTWQVGEQPSPAVVLPSSQVSLPSMTPSPQIGTQGFPGTGQRQPVSTVKQSAEQPSPLILFPSSQASGAVENAVAADVVAHAGLSHRRTDPAVFDLAERRAAVATNVVAVVALLAGIEHSVPAGHA